MGRKRPINDCERAGNHQSFRKNRSIVLMFEHCFNLLIVIKIENHLPCDSKIGISSWAWLNIYVLWHLASTISAALHLRSSSLWIWLMIFDRCETKYLTCSLFLNTLHNTSDLCFIKSSSSAGHQRSKYLSAKTGLYQIGH